MLTSNEPPGSPLTRREVLAALTALTLPLAVRAASSGSASSAAPFPAPARHGPMLHKVLYEAGDNVSLAFGRAAAVLGAPVQPLGDLAALWFDDLAPMWRERRLAVAGVTGPNVLLCLEQLAQQTGQRVVFRVDHRESAPNVIVHRLATPMGWIELSNLGSDWPRAMARAMLGKNPDLVPERNTSTSMVTASTLSQKAHISWIMASATTARWHGSPT